MPHLPQWKLWCDWVRSNQCTDNTRYPIAKINRANARYRLASRFKGLELQGYSDTATAGYESALRLMLSYSAAEAVFIALGQDIKKITMNDREHAQSLRAIFLKPARGIRSAAHEKPMELAAITEGLHKTMRENLQSFLDNKSDDVRIPATAMRHLMAHGTLTLNGLTLTTRRNCSAVDRLSSRLMTEAANGFEVWLTKNLVLKTSG